MGTYTTNKELFMPTVGEQGWGTLVNGNFETIDTFLKPISLSGSTYTFTGNHVGNQSGGSISATSITNSGTLTNTGTSTFTGKITGNGGIGTTSLTTSSTITSTGLITGNGGIGTTSLTTSSTITSTGKITGNGGIQANIIYLPLKTSGSTKVFGVSAINISGQKDTTPDWENATSFTVGSPLFRTTGSMNITVNYQGVSDRVGRNGGVRYYKNGTLIYTFTCTSNASSDAGSKTSFTITLEYGATYKFEFYASSSVNTSYPVTHTLTTTAINHYLY